jgi:hypothetical protein
VDLETVESKSAQNEFAIPYGLLIRTMKIESDHIYHSPRDRNQAWRIRELLSHRSKVAKKQVAAVCAFLVQGLPESKKVCNGIYHQAGEHDGFPRYENDGGKYLYY